MTDPLDGNDDWAELAREFALDKPAPVNEEPAAPAHGEGEGEPESSEHVSGAAESEADDEFEDAEEAPGGEGDGALGTGRKRRRRRRRRRKGAPGETAVPVGAREEGAEEAEAAEEAAEGEPAAEADEAEAPARDEGDEVEDFDADAEPAPLTAEEDTANEVLRELIATWNVPSWDSIISGLYRPN